jgi:CDGSH-type Zn-finger protein
MVAPQPHESAANVCRVSRNGPYLIGGDVAVMWADGVVRAGPQQVLCRCGLSGHKPFCDGTHTKVGFEDPGLLPASAALGGPPQPGRITITPKFNGPLECNGPLTVIGMDDRTATASKTKLCRCGGSQTKPYCDGTHKKIGFTS